VFRRDVSAREDAARQREFKVMTQLKHVNVVKFYAVEQEVFKELLFVLYIQGGPGNLAHFCAPSCFPPFLPRHCHTTSVLLSPFVTTVWTPVVLAIINII